MIKIYYNRMQLLTSWVNPQVAQLGNIYYVKSTADVYMFFETSFLCCCNHTDLTTVAFFVDLSSVLPCNHTDHNYIALLQKCLYCIVADTFAVANTENSISGQSV